MNTGKELIKTLNELIDTISSFTQEEINTIPFEGSWTPGQVARHLIKSYGVAEILNGNVIESKRQPDENFKQIASIFLDFESKFQSPEFIIPENIDFDKQELMSAITYTREEMLQLINNLDLTMICLDFELPGAAVKFTRLEWLYFMMCHTKRHIHQMNKIKQHMHETVL